MYVKKLIRLLLSEDPNKEIFYEDSNGYVTEAAIEITKDYVMVRNGEPSESRAFALRNRKLNEVL